MNNRRKRRDRGRTSSVILLHQSIFIARLACTYEKGREMKWAPTDKCLAINLRWIWFTKRKTECNVLTITHCRTKVAIGKSQRDHRYDILENLGYLLQRSWHRYTKCRLTYVKTSLKWDTMTTKWICTEKTRISPGSFDVQSMNWKYFHYSILFGADLCLKYYRAPR